MSTLTQQSPVQEIEYPDCDGEPMSDNTKQFEWIVTFEGGIDALFRDNPDVFVAGDLLWYPVEGNNVIRTAPDVMVAFGRPKGHRGSYMQWKEGGVAPQVVFEVLSPGNRAKDLAQKFQFYQQYGVEEYYLYDPDDNDLSGWLRAGDVLEEIPVMAGWVSPRLGVRFDLSSVVLKVIGPDGRPFATYVELAEQRDEQQQRAEQERQRAEQADQRAERLLAQLRALGVDPAAE